MLFYFLAGKAGVNSIDEKTVPATDTGQHLGNEISVVAIVVIRIGKDIDENDGGLERIAGDFTIGVMAAGARVKIGSVQQDQAGMVALILYKERRSGLKKIRLVLEP